MRRPAHRGGRSLQLRELLHLWGRQLLPANLPRLHPRPRHIQGLLPRPRRGEGLARQHRGPAQPPALLQHRPPPRGPRGQRSVLCRHGEGGRHGPLRDAPPRGQAAARGNQGGLASAHRGRWRAACQWMHPQGPQARERHVGQDANALHAAALPVVFPGVREGPGQQLQQPQERGEAHRLRHRGGVDAQVAQGLGRPRHRPVHRP
mmetsp:Transcript_17795/g.54047  ORF Transcript_17795/g.54047 Transcript_17795/m.54047 type:complete len:205 (+) Transcript_17795:1139-1753(+)